MRRAEGLVEISRRHFCGGVAAGLAVAGCTDGTLGTVETGPLGGGSGGSDHPDAGITHNPDGSITHPDAGVQATCPSSGVTDVGAPSSFTLNTPKYFSTGKFFVVRDSGGLYALSSVCTHEGATCVTDSGEFFCPRHGATFSYNGDVLGGPVIVGLVHYEMCTLASGNVGVVKSQTVSKTTRLNA